MDNLADLGKAFSFGKPKKEQNNNIAGQEPKIIKVTFFINIIALIISLFYVNKTLIIIFLLLNVLLLGTYWVIHKFSPLFDGIIASGKAVKGLNNVLGRINNG